MIVVSDTGPINYLILIGEIDLLAALYGTVIIPKAVWEELRHENAPPAIAEWIASPPLWLTVEEAPPMDNLGRLDLGEAEAIALAVQKRAVLLLMDEKRGRQAAKRLGLTVTGTVGVLDAAAERGLVNFPNALNKLQSTTFRLAPPVADEILHRHQAKI